MMQPHHEICSGPISREFYGRHMQMQGQYLRAHIRLNWHIGIYLANWEFGVISIGSASHAAHLS